MLALALLGTAGTGPKLAVDAATGRLYLNMPGEGKMEMPLVAEGLRKLAMLAIPRGVRIAYEGLSWGRTINEFTTAWDVVCRADSPNLGLGIEALDDLRAQLQKRIGIEAVLLGNSAKMQEVRRKILPSIEEAVRRTGLRDGMTISFHHGFREGDRCINLVVATLASMGLKNLTLASSSLR